MEVIIKVDLKEISYEDVVWIQLAQAMLEWRAVPNTAINIRVKRGIFQQAEKLSVYKGP